MTENEKLVVWEITQECKEEIIQILTRMFSQRGKVEQSAGGQGGGK